MRALEKDVLASIDAVLITHQHPDHVDPELLGEVLGDKGVHARSAFGVAQIPMGACVEIELIAELA